MGGHIPHVGLQAHLDPHQQQQLFQDGVIPGGHAGSMDPGMGGNGAHFAAPDYSANNMHSHMDSPSMLQGQNFQDAQVRFVLLGGGVEY